MVTMELISRCVESVQSHKKNTTLIFNITLMSMKRTKFIQMQIQPARMDKVLCFSSNILILLKTEYCAT